MKVFSAFLLFIIISSTSFSQPDSKKYNAFSGTTVISLEGGANLSRTDFSNASVDYIGRAHLEYFFSTFTKSSFGLRISGGGGFISGEDETAASLFRTNLAFLGFGIVYSLQLSETVFPFISAGVSNLWFTPRGENGDPLPNFQANKYKSKELNYSGEFGFRFLVTDNFSFNWSAGIQLSPADHLDDITTGANNDLFYFSTIGFSFSFFSERDSDGDGVADSRDNCKNTPPGIIVDEFGCPVDTDYDGVADYLDKCPDTPKDVRVDKFGCALDTDGDKVPDYMDLCPETPIGIPTDDLGCPFDHDADGVFDYLDKCPDTPHEIEVDKNGCPQDSDLDGVPDSKDQCPGTEAGVQVDDKGCPLIKKEEIIEEKVPDIKALTLSADKSFVKGKAELTAAGKTELDQLLKVMKSDPISRWSIEAHTDNVGNQKLNEKISLDWAQAILNYFVSKGIPRNRFEVFAMGMNVPMGDNKTESGRSKNRRIVISRVN